jgi:predicted nucleotidyltransferase
MLLTPKQLITVQAIVKSHLPDAEVYLFGSRIDDIAQKYSDLDILVKMDTVVPLKKLSKLREAFDLSDLPFKVDIIDWHRITPEFRKTIQNRCIPLRAPISI